MLAELMERHGLTAYQVAERSGVSRRSVTKWASGDTPTVTSAVKIASVFGADGRDLLDHWGYDAVDLGAATPDVLDLILAEIRRTNALLSRLDGALRHANREPAPDMQKGEYEA